MGIFGFFKKKKKPQIKINPSLNNGQLKVGLTIDGAEKDFKSLPEKDKIMVAKHLSNKKGDNTKAEGVQVGASFVHIPEISFYGQEPAYSPNGIFMGSYSGKKIVGCKNNQLLFHKTLTEPLSCRGLKVSNNGIFAYSHGLPGKLAGVFYLVNSSGNQIFVKDVSANIIAIGISESGKYSCFHTANSNSEDAVKLFIVDVENNALIGSFRTDPCVTYPDRYVFGEEGRTISLAREDSGLIYEYDFNGKMLGKL